LYVLCTWNCKRHIKTLAVTVQAELSAFDPAFFEEIEDLKHDHHQLALRCAEYERTIQQLSERLR
jgi:hypothetical protein